MALKSAHLQWGEDGVLRSADYGDIYFQPGKGFDESHYVFLEKNRLPERFAAAENGFRVAELGFGTGLNFLLTARLWQARQGRGELLYASIEKHPLTRADLARVLAFWPELEEYAAPLLAQYPPLLEGFYHLRFGNVRLMLCFGDVAEVLPEISGRFDAWYLDGFAPAKNPDMWSENLFPLIAARTEAGGTLSTFSSAGAVRQGLASAGFVVEKVQGFGVKRDMTIANMPGTAPPAWRKKAVVLGAGLGGAGAAYALAQKGCDVTVIDRQPQAGAETSGNPVGVLYPKLTASRSPLGQFHQHGLFFTRSLVTALGLPSWNPCGVVDLDTDEAAAHRHQTMAASGHWPEEFMRYERGALQLPFGGYLSPPEFCQRLLDHPRITMDFSRSISSLRGIEADATVVALGNNTTSFTETAWLPLVSVRGQLSFLTPTEQSKNITHVLCHDGALSPAVNGIHYAGATFQREPVAPPALRDEDHVQNIAYLTRYLPQFGFTLENVVGGRAGYRAATPDHIPLAGRAPDYAAFVSSKKAAYLGNIYIAAGFGGQGLSAAPLAGEVVASQIVEGVSPLPASLAPYVAPERFIYRALKRNKV